MALSPRPIISSPRRRTARLGQPGPEAWSAALAPSQRRAADRRSALQRRRGAERWLRSLSSR